MYFGKNQGALHFLFLTPAARPYLNDVIDWTLQASTNVDRELFIQILRLLVTAKTALPVWETFEKLQPTGLDFILLARLVKFKSTAKAATARVVTYLNAVDLRIKNGEKIRPFALSATQEYAKLPVPAVRAWFRKHLNSPDPDLRRAALGLPSQPRWPWRDWPGGSVRGGQ